MSYTGGYNIIASSKMLAFIMPRFVILEYYSALKRLVVVQRMTRTWNEAADFLIDAYH